MSMRTPNPFRVGDKVRRRRGTLGNIDGQSVEVGVVLAVCERDGPEILHVSIAGRDERFVWETYEKA